MGVSCLPLTADLWIRASPVTVLEGFTGDGCDDGKGVEQNAWQVPTSWFYLLLAIPLSSRRRVDTAGLCRCARTPAWCTGCTRSLWLPCEVPADSPHFSAARRGRRTQSTEKTECVSGSCGSLCGGGRGVPDLGMHPHLMPFAAITRVCNSQ